MGYLIGGAGEEAQAEIVASDDDYSALSDDELKQIQEFKHEMKQHIDNRTFKNQQDYQFFKKIDKL